MWICNNSIRGRGVNNRLLHGSKIGKNQKSYQGWEISDKCDILTVEKITLIRNKTKISLEVTSGKREIEEIQLKESRMRTKKKIE